MRRALIVLVTLTAAAAGLLPATAGVRHDRTVSADPVDWTPHVGDGIVYTMVPVGDLVVVGGSFGRVSEADGSGTTSRRNLFAFDRSTGEISGSFRPSVDGPVLALAPGDDGTVYVGGAFGRVNGVPQRGLVRLDTGTGRRHGTGTSLAVGGGEVKSLHRHGDSLYAGGAFRSVGGTERVALARFHTRSDRLDTRFDMDVAEPRSGRLRVEQLAVSPGGTRLLIGGTFTRVAGQRRHLIAMLDVASSPARLAGWSTDVFRESCARQFDTYLRGLDFAPDGSYFVVVTTGRTTGPRKVCDAALRFETGGAAGTRPTWVNKTGGHSLYAVEVTGPAVYVGGHQRWLDNPHGDKSAGPGAVSRPGIGAIHPTSGKALSWDPTRTRGYGVQCLVSTPDGLLVGSDTDELGHEYHARVGMFPLS